MGRLAATAAVVFAFACASPRPATQVRVTVILEPGVRAESASLAIRVRGAAFGGALSETYATTYSTADVAGIPDPIVLVIAPAMGDPSRLFEAEAEAFDRVGGTVGMARVRGAFQAGRTIEVRLVLEDRCLGVLCPDDETCRQGRCVPSEIPGDLDAGVLDAGTSDGGVVPIGGTCAGDRECDDGVFCNGAEVCLSERCAAGARPTCDDAIACTVDACVSTGCVNRPDAALCTAGPGGTCDVENGGCQYAVCDGSTCASNGCEEAVCEGTICRRRSVCLPSETCCAGRCVRAGCDDGNACTTDLCDMALGCVNDASAPAGVCSDGDVCTVDDFCRRDVCVPGGPRTCDDGNPCTTDRCAPLGGCTSSPVASGTSCADADLCDGTETCVSGTCAPGVPLDCDDRVACTVDACAGGGCSNVPDDTRCTALPGGTCDPVSGCQYSTCMVGTTCIAGPCQSASCAGNTCVVADLCTGAQTCCAGSCVTAGCNDGNPCTADACGAGGCTNVAMAGAACEDGSACTLGDTCNAGGSCTPGPGCSDGNPCTDDGCGAGGCTFMPNTAACDDGNGCTIGDACGGGTCRAGSPLVCEDFNECTADRCEAGACVHDPLSGIGCGELDPCFTYSCEVGICMARPVPGCCATC